MIGGMSSRDEGMAELLSRPSRARSFDAILGIVSVKPSTILDLGCGVGALTKHLIQKFPSSLIVGVDRSKYLLQKSQNKRIALTALVDLPHLPFKESFDLAIAIWVLHEIMSLKGSEALIRTLRNVGASLRSGGELVIFDHVSPGDAPVSVELSNEMQAEFAEFQAKFKHRKITCKHQNEGLVRISLRDLYDFYTKRWALNSKLEEEEMNETHTPFTPEQLNNFLKKAGFKLEKSVSLTPVHLDKGIILRSRIELPERQIVMLARK